MQQQRWVLPPCLLFLNKQDKLPLVTRATVMQQLRRQLGGVVEFQAVFEGAAMRGEGVAALKDYLIQQVRVVVSVGVRITDVHAAFSLASQTRLRPASWPPSIPPCRVLCRRRARVRG